MRPGACAGLERRDGVIQVCHRFSRTQRIGRLQWTAVKAFSSLVQKVSSSPSLLQQPHIPLTSLTHPRSLFSKGTLQLLEVIKQVQSRKPQAGLELKKFRVYRAAKNMNGRNVELGLPLVIELPQQLLTAPRYLKEFSAHINQIVKDAFSQSEKLNTGTRTHRFTCLDPMISLRLHHCSNEIFDNVLQSSHCIPLWFSRAQPQAGEPAISDMQACAPVLKDSLFPIPHVKIKSAATVAMAISTLRRKSISRRSGGNQAPSQAAATQEAAKAKSSQEIAYTTTNLPFPNQQPHFSNLSVQILFDSATPGKAIEEVSKTAVSKFRQTFQSSSEHPFIAIVGSDTICSDDDIFDWSASIAASARNCIIMDLSTNEKSYKPVLRPNCLVPSSPFANAPYTAVEFLFGVWKAESSSSSSSDMEPARGRRISTVSERERGGQSSSAGSAPALFDFKKMLEIYFDLYQEYLSSLYRDTVLICNLCNQAPPDEMNMSYKSLCECMYSILDAPKLVKDIENALSSSSFQSLEPRSSEGGFVWSTKVQNIFWKGVFAGSVFLDLNEILIGQDETKEGLLKMRWNDSLRRVVQHYQNIGDHNLWARPGYAILFAHEHMQQKKDQHDLHRCAHCLVFARFISHHPQNAHQYRHVAPAAEVRVSSSDGSQNFNSFDCSAELLREHSHPGAVALHHQVRWQRQGREPRRLPEHV